MKLKQKSTSLKRNLTVLTVFLILLLSTVGQTVSWNRLMDPRGQADEQNQPNQENDPEQSAENYRDETQTQSNTPADSVEASIGSSSRSPARGPTSPKPTSDLPSNSNQPTTPQNPQPEPEPTHIIGCLAGIFCI